MENAILPEICSISPDLQRMMLTCKNRLLHTVYYRQRRCQKPFVSTIFCGSTYLHFSMYIVYFFFHYDPRHTSQRSKQMLLHRLLWNVHTTMHAQKSFYSNFLSIMTPAKDQLTIMTLGKLFVTINFFVDCFAVKFSKYHDIRYTLKSERQIIISWTKPTL